MPLAHSGWSAWISVDGKELPQYSVKVEERPGSPPDVPKFYTISAWIPSQVGKEFLIHIECDKKIRRKTDCAVYVYLDGRCSNVAKYVDKDIEYSYIFRGERETDNIERPFVFSALQLTDQETIEDAGGVSLNEIGTIEVSFIRHELVSNRCKPSPVKASAINPFSVHEKAKKVTSHCISLGPPKQYVKNAEIVDSREIDEDYFLTFIFHYSSADILRAREIIPNLAVIPSGLDADFVIGGSSNPIEIDDTDEDEHEQVNPAEKRIQEQMEALQKELDALRKRKKDAPEGGLSKKAKTEEDVKPPKT